MARPRAYRSEALVLKTSPMGEAGLIVTLYSRDVGKLRAAAHGIRKPTSKMVGHLEPLNRVELSLVRSGSGDGLDNITQAQVVESFPGLKANLESIAKGVYMAELVDGFGIEGGGNPETYALLVDTLRFLDNYPESSLTLRYFEVQLLKFSGFMPELYRCVECRQEISPGQHVFSPDVGGTLCRRCTPGGPRIMGLSINALKVLRFLDRTPVMELSNLRTNKGLEDEIKGLLSATLIYWLDKEIRSKRFMEHLQIPQKTGVYINGVNY